MAREFRLPDLGEGIAEGQIVRIMCAEGDTIAEDQAIMEVETDKAAVEIPSPFGGKAAKIHVSEGQTVAVGEVLMTFDDDGAAGGAPAEAKAQTPPKAAPTEAAQPAAAPSAPPQPAPAKPEAPVPPTQPGPTAQRTRAAAAPAIRKFARENGIDIDSLTGTGPGGRVVKSDVEAAISGRAPGPAGGTPTTAPAPAPAPLPATSVAIEGEPGEDNWGPIKRARLSQIRKTIANQMIKSVSTIPHVTQMDEADITELEEIRRSLRGPDGNGPRITTMAFVLKTLAHCLRLHPIMNASFDADNEQIVYKEYINIGIAVDSPRGLVVPVIRNVDRLSVLGISQELSKLAEKVRNVQFSVEELRGGTFTVTNYGAIGGIWGTPVINHPEVAILGLGRTQDRLRVSGDEFDHRKTLPLSLSFDHRATDGAQAARFINDVVAHLSSPGLLMIK